MSTILKQFEQAQLAEASYTIFDASVYGSQIADPRKERGKNGVTSSILQTRTKEVASCNHTFRQ